jgi:hypothetical protein
MLLSGIFVLIVLIIIVILRLPSYENPPNISNQIYDLGTRVINITDQYLDKDITDTECVAAIQDLYKQMTYYPETEFIKGAKESDKTIKNFVLKVLHNDLSSVKSGITTRDDILKDRNELAKKLNIKTRK